jgi:hypothetical protein
MTKSPPIQKLEFDQRLWIAKICQGSGERNKGSSPRFCFFVNLSSLTVIKPFQNRCTYRTPDKMLTHFCEVVNATNVSVRLS